MFPPSGFGELAGFPRNKPSGQDCPLGQAAFHRNIGARQGSFGVPVYLGLDSQIGPVYLAYGHAEGGNGSVYLFLGQPF